MCFNAFRLEFLDAHISSEDVEPEYIMTLPPPAVYKDLHARMQQDLPSFGQSRIDYYLSQFSKPFDPKCVDFYNPR